MTITWQMLQASKEKKFWLKMKWKSFTLVWKHFSPIQWSEPCFLLKNKSISFIISQVYFHSKNIYYLKRTKQNFYSIPNKLRIKRHSPVYATGRKKFNSNGLCISTSTYQTHCTTPDVILTTALWEVLIVSLFGKRRGRD